MEPAVRRPAVPVDLRGLADWAAHGHPGGRPRTARPPRPQPVRQPGIAGILQIRKFPAGKLHHGRVAGSFSLSCPGPGWSGPRTTHVIRGVFSGTPSRPGSARRHCISRTPPRCNPSSARTARTSTRAIAPASRRCSPGNCALGRANRHDSPARQRRYGRSIVEPVVRRASRSRCACAASRKG